ncbi:hypothetical protein ACFV2U_45705 [Streptomyces sp. NPDC059697]|uniref:hypothetical protein n=1 Tax=Streptomyces sp. NPDC059697 TaxID=3346912 RepID=UPI0036AEB1E4
MIALEFDHSLTPESPSPGMARLDVKRQSIPASKDFWETPMRRRRRDRARNPLTPTAPDVIAVTFRETVALVEVLEHAHAQISELSNVDKGTIANASGFLLAPSLYARVGLASVKGSHSIPLLSTEVGSLEAAVINLESYRGNEVALCTGYELLENFAKREKNSHRMQYIHGVLAFIDEVGDAANGSAAPSLT